MSNIDEQFIEYIVKSLVSKPDAVSLQRSVDEKGVLLELTVDPEDLGRVIGKRGATAQSLRTLLRALGTKNEARYNLKIVDNGPQDHPGHNPAAAAAVGTTLVDDADDTTPEKTDDPIDDKPPRTSDEDDGKTDILPLDEAMHEDTGGQEVEEKDDMMSKTRKELAELDDLDL